MLWTLFFALVILLILGALVWARGIKYRPGLYIHLRLGKSEVTPVLRDDGNTTFDIGGKNGALLRGENGTVHLIYGEAEEELRWLRGYRYGNGSAKLRVVGTTKNNRMPYRRFVILGAAAAAVIAFIGFGCFRLHRVGQFLDRAQQVQVIHSETADTVKDKNITSMLLVRTDDSGIPDMIKVLSFNRRSKTVKLISLLGDTQVECGGRLCRLCEISAQDAASVVEKNFAIAVDEVLTVDRSSFVKAVDSAAGVRVELSGADADKVNAMLRELYGEDCTLLDTQRRFPAPEDTARIRLDGKQSLCYTLIYDSDDMIHRDRLLTKRQDSVLTALAGSGGLKRFLLHTASFSECADGMSTSIGLGDLMKLGFDTASYWRDYRDSYRSTGSIMLPTSCQEIYSDDGTRTLYTYPAQLRQAVIRILCYDMKG